MATELKSIHPIPPQNLEAEESVLGAMMITPTVISDVVELLREDDFYLDPQRFIFRAIVDLFNYGKPVDPITVTEHLSSAGTIQRVGGKAYIHTLVSTVPAASNAAHYAAIVKDNSLLRSLTRVGNEIADLAYQRRGEVRELLDECEKRMFEVSQHQIRGEFQEIKALVSNEYEQIGIRKDQGTAITGTPTGFPYLDNKTSGFQKSNLIILAARPAVGKSSLALDIAQNAAISHDKAVAVFSLEMSCNEIAQRMISKQAEIDSHKLRTGTVKDNDWPQISKACDRLSKAPIFVDDTPGINMLEIRAKVRRLASKHELGLVIIDYLQLMTPDGKVQNREQEIARISRSLKVMAREINVPVMALSQLSRALEMRGDPEPKLSDLRESGAIEQDADLVLFLFKDGRDEEGGSDGADASKDNSRTQTVKLSIAKHRNGPIGVFKLNFTPKFVSFKEADDRY